MSRDLQVIGEHTVDMALVAPGGFVLDAGCRDFVFARGLVAKDCYVVALDADPTVSAPLVDRLSFHNLALDDVAGPRAFVMTPDPQARHLAFIHPGGALSQAPIVNVPAVSVAELTQRMGVGRWEVVKLDVEGAEYDILRTWPGPIARQISVEFHEHVRPRPPQVYDEILAHLGQWYEVVQHEKSARHCCAPNFWDSLFVLKESA